MCAVDTTNLVFFSCPDCEDGQMRRTGLGTVSNYFKCGKCDAEIFFSQKTMDYMAYPFRLPNLPSGFDLKPSNPTMYTNH